VTDVLVISGPAGVGKSVTAFEVSHQLQAADVGHVLIDTDELDRIYPVPDDLADVTERNLAAMWRTFAEQGARRLIIVGVYLDRAPELEWVRRAIPDATITCVRLSASDGTLVERVTRRELGSDRDGQLERTRRQVVRLEADRRDDITTIATDGRSLDDIAREILAVWQPAADEARRNGT
jgi:Mrp family chromosome partitioning ATPase